MPRSLLLALALVIALWPAVAAAQECRAIRFAPGASSAEITGAAPAEGVLCYTLQTGAGQDAELRVLDGRNVIFTVEGVADARGELRFRTEARTYRIRVGQLMRAVRDEPFRIRVAVTGAASRPGAAGGGAWRGRIAGITARAEGRAEDGPAKILIFCRKGGPPRATLQLYGTDDLALPRADGAVARAEVVVALPGGPRRLPLAITRHDGNDSFWEAGEALDTAFLDAFARGSAMTLVNEGGREVKRFGLAGSARARAGLRETCGF